MKKLFVLLGICGIGVLLANCFFTGWHSPVEKAVKMYRQEVDNLYNQVGSLVEQINADETPEKIQQQFKKARLAYKKAEWLAEYYNSYTAKQINGPALEEVEADEKGIVIQPEGFQVVEEYLFPAYDPKNKEEVLHQARILHSNVGRLRNVASLLQTTDAHLFDALRLQIVRMIALGISGFDSPVVQNSIPEAAESLQAIQDYYSLYEPQLQDKNGPLADKLKKLFDQAQHFLSVQTDFVAFDRMKLITGYLNPISESLLQAQRQLNIAVFQEPRALRAYATNLFAKNAFNANFYTPATEAYSNWGKTALGRQLFSDGILSGDGKMSCATCHQPEKAFSDGLVTSLGFGGTAVSRNAPTLLNAALQPSLFYDTRVSFLEDQAKDVISSKKEMHGSLDEAVQQLKRNRQYKTLFEAAYGTQEISEYLVRNALASYIRSLVALNSRFDQYMRGDTTAMNRIEINGFNLFMGKAKCGTCHFVPLFNGSNPPLFDRIDAEVIGVPATTDTLHPVLDTDEGKYGLYKIALHRHAFKTPTLRNVALTAPYMHNGVYQALEEVIDFYDRGGGLGLGVELDNQTLPADPLHLTASEKTALVAFLRTLTDTSGIDQ